MKTETIRTTTFTTTSEEGDTTNADLGAEWQDILNQHAPLREYVRKRALRGEERVDFFHARRERREGGQNEQRSVHIREGGVETVEKAVYRRRRR